MSPLPIGADEDQPQDFFHHQDPREAQSETDTIAEDRGLLAAPTKSDKRRILAISGLQIISLVLHALLIAIHVVLLVAWHQKKGLRVATTCLLKTSEAPPRLIGNTGSIRGALRSWISTI